MTIRVLKSDPLKHSTDLLAVAVFEGEKKLRGLAAEIDKSLGGILSSLIQDEGFKGKERETLLAQTHGRIGAKRVLFVGLGKEKNFTTDSARQAAALTVKRAHEYAAKSVSFSVGKALRASAMRFNERARAITEGVLLGSYHYTTYHGQETKDEHEKRRAEEVILLAPDALSTKQIEAGIAEGQLNAEAAIFARDLVNAPASDMTPQHLVDVAKDIAGKSKRISLEVFDEKEARKRGMGAFLAVAKGSDIPPYFIHLTYKPKAKKTKKVFLVGKGITFDSGGLSLKPSKNMESMKNDMAGGAAVLAVFYKLDELQPKVEVHGVIPCTENMPSGRAVKPGDIARAMNGKTIEILNTDAEGRVALADALSFAVKEGADTIVDLATLTGSCIEALGEEVAGLFGNSRQLTKQLTTAAENAGEYVWEMPMVKEYQPLIKSKVADIKNIGDGRGAGSITAALFLKEFIGETPWAHLDIAGPAWAEKETFPSVPLGATGFGVRTLIMFLKSLR
ncbi:hypothetical protein A3H10_02055 [Candidatus Uhrbacteria bacterium RIFCSPLOWO2_12_FULL_46_10]|uniref:Probable cytosol aminopeptidase n=1 Tax=Candidatus Uhrbacteria bacterium RIFCSPLOWO2_01_FULL_47_25 TaxID=1802402 RepID=A0A1F7UTN3_9BACT|nr:MAG: hypothetical protein A3E96_04015 [Candidatus Uhrbacteria bacterium RIFCSPHIGHO2_12_FULL_46_13]OGL81625.1 MAG: hypothetical protein A2936_04545 [Candidatus Uhrbacteria bacterium RIFCSPLOWO2_01_FULL_47_25]OGL84810.1 MAG: hypothetical protein A3I37_05285 [Candidatus Uhrbacteria bacterium RIFCSPLOWO2_02_FULL_46_19]OGL91273.1 MAG: hypothetical protein A3H10_02055 [Candidatus Uhrbacteria bacterium RIFCSPLOWO2_12_FULL_46_10]